MLILSFSDLFSAYLTFQILSCFGLLDCGSLLAVGLEPGVLSLESESLRRAQESKSPIA